ncbi:hypothetical protein OG883_41540 [Streptomyces sp. NBC_01142]|uniref:hypothetical protein n=1 Tax=Streptomyces sp. NBC_01142 TaxID=2975865 RepID=UPI00224EAE3C|nr:hypothetical protein [Streptomyces sp. NBC_01142]MCX4826157.1 hypothetical protein [Streptomyces sp. NBC_01142]
MASQPNRFCTEIERVYLDADGDVVQYAVTVDYTNREHRFTGQPTPEDLARRV